MSNVAYARAGKKYRVKEVESLTSEYQQKEPQNKRYLDFVETKDLKFLGCSWCVFIQNKGVQII